MESAAAVARLHASWRHCRWRSASAPIRWCSACSIRRCCGRSICLTRIDSWPSGRCPRGNPIRLGTSSIPRYFALRDRAQSFEAVGAFNGVACGIKTLGFDRDGVAAERILGQTVSPTMFRTLGVQPIMGRDVHRCRGPGGSGRASGSPQPPHRGSAASEVTPRSLGKTVTLDRAADHSHRCPPGGLRFLR